MKNYIMCPECGTKIALDEADLTSIKDQIRDQEFKTEVESEVKRSTELAIAQTESKYKDILSQKDLEYQDLRARATSEYRKKEAQVATLQETVKQLEANKENAIAVEVNKTIKSKEEEINNLKASLKAKDAESKAEVSEMLNIKDNEIANLKEKYANELSAKQAKIASLEASAKESEEAKANAITVAVSEAVKDKEDLINKLESDLKVKDAEFKAKVDKAIADKDVEINELNTKLLIANNDYEAKANSLKNDYETKLKAKDEEVAFYRDFKAKESTKAIGEDLEQYVKDEFDKIRSVAYPTAYFEKDNEVSTESGSKGDFIFKDHVDGEELISIMIECKNEADDTKTKHKNSDFFKELDKDRTEKKCEYAILISMLEADSDLYNTGIVEVHGYPKMYVVRPQFYLQLIGLLRNSALNSIEYKKQLSLIKQEDIDITNFENNLDNFKEGFLKNVINAHNKYESAIKNIDKVIDYLNKVKDALLGSGKNLTTANNKLQKLDIKKLSKDSPSIASLLTETSSEEAMDDIVEVTMDDLNVLDDLEVSNEVEDSQA